MKKLFIVLFGVVSLAFADTGWFADYILIKVNGNDEAYYWIGSDPGFGTQFDGHDFGTVTSLVISGCDMKYWSDDQDRTGGAFYWRIGNSGDFTEVIWNHASIGGNDYQGTLSEMSTDITADLENGSDFQLHIYAKSWGSSQGDSYLSNGGANYTATFDIVDRPFEVSAKHDLLTLSGNEDLWASEIIQTADITFAAADFEPGGDFYNDGKGLTPIGYLVDLENLSSSDNHPFTGSYNGQGFKIGGLYMNQPENSGIGLFGMTRAATLANMVLEEVDICGATAVGALVGWHLLESTVTNCSSTGSVTGEEYTGGLLGLCGFTSSVESSSSSCTVTGTNDRCGGLVGMLYTSCIINNSYTDGNVLGAEYSGGLVGFSFESEINYSFNLGEVSGTGHVGGLVGCNDDNTLISNCYNLGNVIGTTSDIGGLAGYNGASADIEYSYSTGQVTGDLTTGGFVGNNDGDGSNITACFWDTESSGQATSDGGTGQSASQMRAEATFTGASWDFTTIWDINSRNNAAYPFLLWQSFPPEPLIKTLNVSGITTTSANIGGYITSLGTSDPSQHGLCWNKTGDPDINDVISTEGEAVTVGDFSSSMTGLDPNTRYYVKAYATNLSGTSYGKEVSFSTLVQAQITFTDGGAFNPNFTRGQEDQAIGRFALTSDLDGRGSLNSVNIIVNGTRTGLSNFHLWYSFDNSFNRETDVQIGNLIATDPGDGASLNFSALTLPVNTAKIYFFITCDMASDASGSIQGVIADNDAFSFTDAALTGSIDNAPLSGSDIPLPITLASFAATALNGAVSVTWVTELETENAHFLLYRDGAVIAQIAGAGTSSEPHSYAYTDQYVVPGKIYTYQLADVSLDGEETKHPRVEVQVKAEGIAQDYNIGSAYPNPFNPVTVVPVNLAKEAAVTATLYDMAGRPLTELHNGALAAGSHALRIDGAGLSTGIYFVRIGVNDQMHVQKIALMK